MYPAILENDLETVKQMLCCRKCVIRRAGTQLTDITALYDRLEIYHFCRRTTQHMRMVLMHYLVVL